MKKIALAIALVGSGAISACGAPPISQSAPDPAPATEAPTPEPTPDYWQQALDTGYAAAVAAGEASTPAEWKAVHDQWNEAVQLLSQMPVDAPNYAAVADKKAEYQANRAAAKANYEAAGGTQPQASEPASSATSPLQEFKAELRDSEGIELLVDIDSILMTDEGVAVILTTQYGNLNSGQQEELITNLGRIWWAKAGSDANLFAYVNTRLVGSATVHRGRVVVQVD